MRTIAILNQKGGVGKTTTVVNIAAALAAMGSRVLAIDLDPQAHLTIHFGLEPQTIDAGSYKVLTQSAAIGSEILLTRLNLWVLPANINLVGAETELVSVVGREIILREALEEVADKFDFCLIDCPPSLGLLTLNALAAAQEVLIPLQPHFLALQGFGKLLQTIELVNKRINPELKVEGILLCMFDTRASLPSEVRADIEQFLSNARGTNCAWAKARILPTFIRRNIKLAEAPSYGKTIFEYEQNCHGAEDYKEVAEFIRSRFQTPRQTDTPKPVAAVPMQKTPKAPEPQQPNPQPVHSGENQGPTPTRPTAPLQPNPTPQPTREPQPQPPIKSSPVAKGHAPAAGGVPQPKPRLSSTYEYRPQPPTASSNSQLPPQPTPRPSNPNGLQPPSPVENRLIAPQNPQTPSQPTPQSNDANGLHPRPPIKSPPVAGGSSQAPGQPKPQLSNTYESHPGAPARNEPVAPPTIQAPIPPQPKVQPNSNPEHRSQSPVEIRPLAPRNPQATVRPNPQAANTDQIRHKAPIEIRHIRQAGSQTPQQQATKQLDNQDGKSPPATQIRQTEPQNVPTPILRKNSNEGKNV